MTLDEIKNYLRIELDNTDDDIYLESLITASQMYIKNTVGKELEDTNELYNIAVKLMIAQLYQNRQPVSEKNQYDIPYTLTCLIQHLSICGEY